MTITDEHLSESALFEDILNNEKITSMYQPIVNLRTSEIIGYEALSRGPEQTQFYSPLALIEKAHELNRIWDLEMLFRKKALEKLHKLGKEKFLFINVDPDVIKTPEFKSGLTKEYLEQVGGEETSIVFEITERTAISDYAAFQMILENYRRQGYMVAIDDVGAGYSGLKTINELRPNFIKIDMDLIRNIDKDAFKQALIKAFVDTSLTTNIKIIAEGIETKEEMKTLILLGVHAGQGFYLKKPAHTFESMDEETITRIHDYNKIAKNLNAFSKEYHYISNLIMTSQYQVYESMAPAITVKNYLDKTNIKSVCICENNCPVGLVMKHNLDACLSGKYGFALYSNKPISRIMNTSPLIVDLYTPISVVAKTAMGRSDDQLFDDVIVTKGSKYFGTVSMKKIFEYTLLFEKNNAKENNPLTGLPGNPVITRVLSDLVSYKNASCILYVDINEFKIYNDVYGFEKGDFMIKYIADMMGDIVKKDFPFSSFVGHIGGDDFIVVIDGELEKCKAIAQCIIDNFENQKSNFFTKAHITCGEIQSEDRFGIVRNLKLTSLSIAGIYGDLSAFKTSERLSENLAQIKKNVKKIGKSSFLIKRASHDYEKYIDEPCIDTICDLFVDCIKTPQR